MNGAEFLIGFDSKKKLRLTSSLAQGAGRQQLLIFRFTLSLGESVTQLTVSKNGFLKRWSGSVAQIHIWEEVLSCLVLHWGLVLIMECEYASASVLSVFSAAP